MKRSRVMAVIVAVAAAALVVGAATAAGPSPGTIVGFGGALSTDGKVRFVAVTSAHDTIVEKIDTRTGRVLRFGSIRGGYGIPLAAFDGTTTALTHDGKAIVLSTFPGQGIFTRFAVFDTSKLQIRDQVSLRGTWSLDALSPDGSTLFLIQYLSTQDTISYRVRAYDLRADKLVAGAIVDKSDPAAMTGLPMTRVSAADAAWAYTLYSRNAGYGDKKSSAFIHALDTKNRAAVCIDLPWTAGPDAVSRVHMSLTSEGLVLTQPGVGRLAVVDLQSYKVQTLRAPVGSP